VHTESKIDFIKALIEDLEQFGVGTDEPIAGSDAVDYLNEMHTDLCNMILARATITGVK